MGIEVHTYVFFDLRVVNGDTYIVIEVCPHYRSKFPLGRCVFRVEVCPLDRSSYILIEGGS